MVSIPACHAGDPGSIPGLGVFFCNATERYTRICIFILTEAGAPAASLLTDIGLNEGTANDHPGQGTSNRRFFFADSMLELLYIRDAKEAKEGSGCGLRLAE